MRRRELGAHGERVGADRLQQRAGQRLGVVEQRDGQVGRLDGRIAPLGGGLTALFSACVLRVVMSMGIVHLIGSRRVTEALQDNVQKLSLFRSTPLAESGGRTASIGSSAMRGIVLAGGAGTRLHPITRR